jgi:FMN phosphatase YigB (HAD superfamily)
MIRLIAFDVDGTLVENDHGLVVWQVLNDRFVGNELLNEKRFRDYLAGALTYPEWVRLDNRAEPHARASRRRSESIFVWLPMPGRSPPSFGAAATRSR